MGVGGSALAVEAASVVIMSNNLLKVPATCMLCRDTVRIIVINCGASIAIKLVAATLACAGCHTISNECLLDVFSLFIYIVNILIYFTLQDIYNCGWLSYLMLELCF